MAVFGQHFQDKLKHDALVAIFYDKYHSQGGLSNWIQEAVGFDISWLEIATALANGNLADLLDKIKHPDQTYVTMPGVTLPSENLEPEE